MLTFALMNVDRTRPDSCMSPSPQGASPSLSPQSASPSRSPQGMSPSPSPQSMSLSPSPDSDSTIESESESGLAPTLLQLQFFC